MQLMSYPYGYVHPERMLFALPVADGNEGAHLLCLLLLLQLFELALSANDVLIRLLPGSLGGLGNRLGLLKLASQGLPERFSSLPCSAHRQRGIFRNLHVALIPRIKAASWTGKELTQGQLCIQASHAWSSEIRIAGPLPSFLYLYCGGGDTEGQAQQRRHTR